MYLSSILHNCFNCLVYLFRVLFFYHFFIVHSWLPTLILPRNTKPIISLRTPRRPLSMICIKRIRVRIGLRGSRHVVVNIMFRFLLMWHEIIWFFGRTKNVCWKRILEPVIEKIMDRVPIQVLFVQLVQVRVTNINRMLGQSTINVEYVFCRKH